MKLKRFNSQFPVQLFDENGSNPQSFMLGMVIGKGTVSEIELTPLGVMVHRDGASTIVFTYPGYGEPLEEAPKQPAGLKR